MLQIFSFCIFDNPCITTIAADDRNEEYNGETMSMIALAKLLTGVKYAIEDPRCFKCKGKFLNDIRLKLGV